MANATSQERYGRKQNPRALYRLRRTEEINNSPTLSEKFPHLKALRVTVDYFDPTGATRRGGMKNKVNPTHGKSLLVIHCVNSDCAGGDYDLTAQLAEAIAARRKMVEGELRCQGMRHNKERREDLPCQAVLRYKLALGF